MWHGEDGPVVIAFPIPGASLRIIVVKHQHRGRVTCKRPGRERVYHPGVALQNPGAALIPISCCTTCRSDFSHDVVNTLVFCTSGGRVWRWLRRFGGGGFFLFLRHPVSVVGVAEDKR
ncbi:unnamed protein product [Amoebophrya sp. A120]|nr:unnamed protein product [Amoebophrya sp. A120]|eukprot:GSA120T00007486001.1